MSLPGVGGAAVLGQRFDDGGRTVDAHDADVRAFRDLQVRTVGPGAPHLADELDAARGHADRADDEGGAPDVRRGVRLDEVLALAPVAQEPRTERREHEDRDDEGNEDLCPDGRPERRHAGSREGAPREHEEHEVEGDHLDERERDGDRDPPQQLGHGVSPIPASCAGCTVLCRRFASLYLFFYRAARAVHRPERRSSSSGSPNAPERFSAVSVSSTGPAACTVPSRSKRTCVKPGGISSTWCVTRTSTGDRWSPASSASALTSSSRPPRSSPAAGSSSSKSSGSVMSERAIWTLLRSPSLSVPKV